MSSRVRKPGTAGVDVQFVLLNGRCDRCHLLASTVAELTFTGAASPTGRRLTAVLCAQCVRETLEDVVALVGHMRWLASPTRESADSPPPEWPTEAEREQIMREIRDG